MGLRTWSIGLLPRAPIFYFLLTIMAYPAPQQHGPSVWQKCKSTMTKPPTIPLNERLSYSKV